MTRWYGRADVTGIFLLSILSSVWVQIGCATLDKPPARADLSSPKAAALTYLKAIQYEDVKMARAISIGTLEQKSWIDAYVAMLDGMRRYDTALTAKFGHIINQTHVDLQQNIREMADQPVELISAGSESGNDRQARIDPKRAGFLSHSQIPICLKKEKQGWMVDLAQTYAHEVPAQEMETISAKFRQTRIYGQIFQKMALDVKAGQFRNTDEANKALAARLSEASEPE